MSTGIKLNGFKLGGMIMVGALVLAPSAAYGAAAPKCGDGVRNQAYEVCDYANRIKNDMAGKTCTDFAGYSGGTLLCSADCKAFDLTKCTPWDAGVIKYKDSAVALPDGLVFKDAGVAPPDAAVVKPDSVASADAGVPAGPTCRDYPQTPMSFNAGSLIIPMHNPKHRPYGQSIEGMRLVFGMLWHLLRHGIRIHWIIDTTAKSAAGALPTDPDFTISGTAPVISELARGSGLPYDNFTDISASSVTYSGGAFVIRSAEADAALKLIHHGVLPEDPSVQFGWSLDSFYDPVVIQRANASFNAPVVRVTSKPFKPVAVYDAASANWMGAVLELAGLNFTGTYAAAGGTHADPGLIYDVLSSTDMADSSILDPDYYQSVWVAYGVKPPTTGSLGVLPADAIKNIANMVNSGSGMFASGWAIGEMECYGCPANKHNDCRTCTAASPIAATRFQGKGGMQKGSPFGAAPPVAPWNPYSQTDDLEYHGLADELKSFAPIVDWEPCVQVLAYDGSYVLISLLDRADKGPVMYVAGRNYAPGGAVAEKMVAMQRTVLAMLFYGGDEVQDDFPHKEERTRSSPVLVEYDDGTTLNMYSIQGSFVWPLPLSNLLFNASAPTSWSFPGLTGHLRVYDMTGLTDGTLGELDDGSTLSVLWDGASNIPAAASRKMYTAYGSSALKRVTFENPSTTSGKTWMAAQLDVSVTDMPNLVAEIRGAALGGIDLSTPAYIAEPPGVSFPAAASYSRPPVIYAAGYDGMLHAFKSKDLENNSGSFGSELWAFIPPNLLGSFRHNDTAIHSSPTVADLYGDFLDASSGGVAGQDNRSEWVTLLTLAVTPLEIEGKFDNRIYALDVSNPDPASTACPVGLTSTSCQKGVNPLWVFAGSELGMSKGTAIAVANVNNKVTPHVFVTSNAPGASGAGLRLFALDATTGSQAWVFSVDYKRKVPEVGWLPNDVPPVPALVDKTGSNGYQTHAYIGDMQGLLWEVDLETGTGKAIWDVNKELSDTSDEARYPIAAPVALYRDTAANLHVVLATGGAYWAPSTSSIRQKLVDVNVSESPAKANILHTFAEGERVYTAPVVSNHDVYLTSSEGLVDVLSGWSGQGSGGTLYRVNMADPTTPTVSSLKAVGMGSSSVGVSSGNRVVATTATKTGVVGNSGKDTVATAPDVSSAGPKISKLRLWLPGLRQVSQ